MKRFSEPYVMAKRSPRGPSSADSSVYESRKARNAPYPPVYDYLNDFVCHHLDLARYFMGDVEYVYAELVSRTHDPDNLNARLFEHEDVFRNWAAVLRDNPHVPQSDGYLITFRFTSGAIGVHNANTLETDTNLLERVTLTGEGAVVAVEDWYRVRAAIKDQPPMFWEPLIDRQVRQCPSAANRLLRRGARVRRRDARRARHARAPTSTTAWRAWSWSPRCGSRSPRVGGSRIAEVRAAELVR